ncbi:selenide, water dikinase SelD [candidate division KSB1 bacterium]|nr:selenide, water dikinase SelD [candidate division KSB1 bacterium]RQW01662.1 MAG: selenide, water dikinase SelD [candidate division KSB1 bacterium]
MAAALEKLPKQKNDPRLLVGFNTADDAGIVKINDELALVQTVDFFTPIVDDPYMYGQIAAANSLSDVYAMGGTPLSALNVVGFPKNLFPIEVLAEILAGGQDKAREADTLIVGGHTIGDDELKYGLAVTGTIHPEKIITNSGAQPGDMLLLTKPIGTGTITTALKNGQVYAAVVDRVSKIMATLNKAAAELCQQVGVHAMTDITGFGLLGHALEMAHASHAGFHFYFEDIPILPEALTTTAIGAVPGGTKANHLYTAPNIDYAATLTLDQQWLLNDPQTSGGLLIAVAAHKGPHLIKMMAENGVDAPMIGFVTDNNISRIKII